jgi:hypothetical protein
MSSQPVPHSPVHFWAIGDLHYYDVPAWHAFHQQRLAPLFDDLRTLWHSDTPFFCASPGDLIETCAIKNYELARGSLAEQLPASVPFYPGVGNHEYHNPDGEDPDTLADAFATAWQKPLRYSWANADVVGIMLDYPSPFPSGDPVHVFLSDETLAFLDETLSTYADRPAVIFQHCPLYNTVLDRDPKHFRDFNSLQHFFSLENSAQVREILARHTNAHLFISGHTHSGWQAPNLVVTERLGDHQVTFVNLMSPWYTGTHTGPLLNDDQSALTYIPDQPDVIVSFSFEVYDDHTTIRVREHRTRQWLQSWDIPLTRSF